MSSPGIAVLDVLNAIDAQTERQVAHWALAAARFDLDDLASREAWAQLEQYLGLSLRRHLQGSIDQLLSDARVLTTLQGEAETAQARSQVLRKLLAFRRQYLRTETTLDFFADAINSRTSAKVGALLRACDTLAYRSMAHVLDPLDYKVPIVLTYLDLGLGASILKAGLRLWDGGRVCPVASIKITRHNLLRPTALIHEAGHQVAHITSWNGELATALRAALARAPSGIPEVWSSWASEVAADAFAFSHAGYASVAALHDVLAGEPALVFRYSPGDPHPVSYLRVLLGVEMCRYFYGEGPWDDMALSWTRLHPLKLLDPELRALIQGSLPWLKTIVQVALDTKMAAFKGRSLRELSRPERVSPPALAELDAAIGGALFTSAHWLWTEPLRILALTGLKVALKPHEADANLTLQEQAMLRLGGALRAA